MDFKLNPTLSGELVELRPLKSEDFPALYAVASDPLIWEQHPHKERYQFEVFKDFFRVAMDSQGAFLITKKDSGDVIGSSRYYDWDPLKRQVAIGFSFLARSCWGHTYNAEVKKLMLDHAFEFADSVIFHIGESNIRSQKAIEKIGAQFIERASHTLPDGSPYTEVVYEIKPQQMRSL